MKKYHKIIWGLETIADIQLQLQNIVKLADTMKNQLTYIENTLLQASKDHKIQIDKNTYSISKELWNIIHEEMEYQVHHIQVLLADKLNHY